MHDFAYKWAIVRVKLLSYWDFARLGYCPSRIIPSEILSRWDIVQVGHCPSGILS
jgi:hypothetical protein